MAVRLSVEGAEGVALPITVLWLCQRRSGTALNEPIEFKILEMDLALKAAIVIEAGSDETPCCYGMIPASALRPILAQTSTPISITVDMNPQGRLSVAIQWLPLPPMYVQLAFYFKTFIQNPTDMQHLQFLL